MGAFLLTMGFGFGLVFSLGLVFGLGAGSWFLMAVAGLDLGLPRGVAFSGSNLMSSTLIGRLIFAWLTFSSRNKSLNSATMIP